ncbi:hypothetical protein G5I_13416 [Acromyrmex echinatior]|uniref:Uncharacterized protein n=1 Tax=Acromyrmex echinatior TaxID=103372 RepID=F4X4Z3_ACREC|nr:hypothetical protein G5I_13416 [Acromyrmex echinatior]
MTGSPASLRKKSGVRRESDGEEESIGSIDLEILKRRENRDDFMDFVALRAGRMLQENFKKFATGNRDDMLIRHQCELNKFRRVVSGVITSQFRHKDNTRIPTRCDEITLPHHLAYQIHNAFIFDSSVNELHLADASNPSYELGYNPGTDDIQSDIRRRSHPPTQPTDRLRRKHGGCSLVRESLESKNYTESYSFSHSCAALVASHDDITNPHLLRSNFHGVLQCWV